MPRDHLYIPIETKVRELHGKLLLGLFAARAGFDVVLGDHIQLLERLAFLPRGIFLEKGISSVRRANLKRLGDLGYCPVSWCEEGLVTLSPDNYARDRVDRYVVDRLTCFYAWGCRQAAIIAGKVPSAAPRIHITGNPRFDLLRPPYRNLFSGSADEYRRRFGDFILVNTNFGLYNNFLGKDFFISRMMGANTRIIDHAHHCYLRNYVAHVKSTYLAFQKLIQRLAAAFPDRTVVVRPHPSENHTNWQKSTAGLANIAIIHEGSVIPWLIAAGAIVHNSCTTAVEGRVLGRCPVAYRPLVSDIYEPSLPKAVSRNTFFPEETIDAVRDALKSGASAFCQEADETLETYCAGLSGPFASERIVGSLVAINRTEKRPSPYWNARTLGWVGRDMAAAVKRAVMKGTRPGANLTAYRRQKFPGLEKNEVIAAVAALKRIDPHFGPVGVHRVAGASNCYRLVA